MLAAFNAADVAAIQPSLVRQHLLRHPKLSPAGADALAEYVEIGIAHPSKSWVR